MDITLDKLEILWCLGYKKQVIDDAFESLIDAMIEKFMQTVNPRYVFEIFDIILTNHEVEIKNCGLKLTGKGILEHLKNNKKCIVLAATLGVEVDSVLKFLQMTSMTQAVIFDVCATVYIEKVCSFIEAELKMLGYNMTFRYSPGYNGFPIENQKVILTLVDAQKIGLIFNENFLLMPQKSVTAVIGITEFNASENQKCVVCKLQGN
ncbi:MAG: methionine synthase [Nitrososphaerota archaeon]|nr:methionine synthase [Nitrososphaerota archaeon]